MEKILTLDPLIHEKIETTLLENTMNFFEVQTPHSETYGTTPCDTSIAIAQTGTKTDLEWISFTFKKYILLNT